VEFFHHLALETHPGDSSKDAHRTQQVSPVGRVVEERHLDEESNDNFKAENHRHLGWCDVRESSGEENPANDSDKGGGQGKHPVNCCPTLEGIVHVPAEARCRDDESADGKPEHKHGIVNMFCLSGDDVDHGGENWDGESPENSGEVLLHRLTLQQVEPRGVGDQGGEGHLGGKEAGGSSYNDHPCDADPCHCNPPQATVVLE